MNRRLLFLLAAVFLTGFGAIYGQKTISGSVSDSGEDKGALVNVSVQVKGTTIGTITDIDGNFEITLPEGATTLVFALSGYGTKELVAKNGMQVVLDNESKVLGEVTVTVAYNMQKGKGYAGSAQTITAETIEKKSPADITKALAGEFPGVQVFTTNGQPGVQSSIRIRGLGSISSSSEPLYVVDGIPYSGDINAIDPSDIASTTILKDATSTALYGSRGSNGVILITTKKGTAGKDDKIEVDLKYGGNMRLNPMYRTIKSPERYAELGWQGLVTYFGGNDNPQAKTLASKSLFDNGTDGVDKYYNLWDCNNGSGEGLIDPITGKFTGRVRDYTPEDWVKHIYSTGQRIEANVKFHGGSEKTQYYTSVGYLKDEGYYISSKFDRFSVRSNLDAEPKKWLKLNLNLSYAYTDMSNPGQVAKNANNGFYFVNTIPAIYPVFRYEKKTNGQTGRNRVWDDRTDYWMYDFGDGVGNGRGFQPGQNPAGSLQWDVENYLQHQFMASSIIEVNFHKTLKFISSVGFIYNALTASELINPYYGDGEGMGHIIKENDANMQISGVQQLIYQNTFGDDHHFDAFVAHEAVYARSSVLYGYKSNLYRSDGMELDNASILRSVGSDMAGAAMESYFGQVRYNWRERYFIDGNARRDGNSTFYKGSRWGWFGSIGGSWLMTNESFMRSAKSWLKSLKLKASFGVLGNADFAPYQYTSRYTLGSLDGENTLIWSAVGNRGLTWEKANKINAGAEFTISKYFTGEIEYFYNYISDLKVNRSAVPSMGYSSYPINDGIMMNMGVEALFKAHILNTRSVKLDVRLSASNYTNKMIKMPIDPATGKERIFDSNIGAKGHSLYEWLIPEYAGVNSKGQALYYRYFDINSPDYDESHPDDNYIYNVFQYEAEHPNAAIRRDTTTFYPYAGNKYVGKSAIPVVYGGLGIDLTAYGVDFSVTLNYSIGGYGYDNMYATLMHSDHWGTIAWHEDINNAWTPENTNTNVPSLSNGAPDYTYSNSGSTRFLTSNSYLHLSNIRIGYSFPQKWIKRLQLSNLNIWVSGDNLAIITARKGYLPNTAVDGSSSMTRYAPMTTIQGGIKFTF